MGGQLLAPADAARAFRGRLSPKRRSRVEEGLGVPADLGLARKAEAASTLPAADRPDGGYGGGDSGKRSG